MSTTFLPEIDGAACTGCGECIMVCAPRALTLQEGKAIMSRPDLCEFDGGCEPACPEGVISLPYRIVFDQTL